MTIMESLSDMKARVEELKGLVKDQRERKDEYAAIISHQSEGVFSLSITLTAVVFLQKYYTIMLEKLAYQLMLSLGSVHFRSN